MNPLRIESVAVEPIEHPLRDPILRHGRPVQTRGAIRVTLHDGSGARGVGEAWPLVSAGTEPMHETAESILRLRPELEGARLTLPQLLDRLDAELAATPAARAGFDMAAHDLDARLRGLPLASRLGAAPGAAVRVNAVLGSADVETTVRLSRAACAAGYTSIKLKVGATKPSVDIDRVAAVRDAVGRDVELRVDANGAWPPELALEILRTLEASRISLAEQPVVGGDLDGLAWVHARSPIPIGADESLADAAGRARLLRGDLASVAVVKLMVAGGLRPAAELCAAARDRGIPTLVTTTFDGPIATAAALHLAAACGSPTLAHGLDASSTLACRFPGALVPSGGILRITDDPGLSVAEHA